MFSSARPYQYPPESPPPRNPGGGSERPRVSPQSSSVWTSIAESQENDNDELKCLNHDQLIESVERGFPEYRELESNTCFINPFIPTVTQNRLPTLVTYFSFFY